MSNIVNPAWKSLKEGAEVVFKGDTYTIGSNAFGSLDAAVDKGIRDDLVIVDKNLSSPVKKTNITGAATDIFTEIINDPEAVGTVTTNRTVKFTAAAGGTASIKDEDATLIGFDKVTANKAGGEFTGGKQDINSTVKIVEDSDREIETADKTSAISSTATGSLTVTGVSKDDLADVKVGPIAAESTDSQPVDVIAEAFEKAAGKSYEDDKTGASYANVTIKLAEIDSAINGGTSTEKATVKTSDTAGSKIDEEYTYSLTQKAGAGTAALTDASAEAVYGFNNVKITVSSADSGLAFGELSAEATTEDHSLKTAYVEDVSATVTSTHKDNDSSSGSLTVAGKSGKTVAIGAIDGFTSLNLKYATVSGEIDADTEIESESTDIAVKAQKDNNAITYSYSSDKSETANGSLTADNADLGNLDGVKTVTLKTSSINGEADATDVKVKTTVKLTGIAAVDISSSPSEYLGTAIDDLYAADEAFTADTYAKTEKSVGGTSFKMSGKASAASKVTVEGYKTVDLDNTDNTNTLTAEIVNDASTTEASEKIVYAPESSYTETETLTTSNKAFGTANIKTNTAASASGVETVKVTGNGNTTLGEVFAQRTETYTGTSTITIKAGKDNPTGNYTNADSKSAKATASLEAKKVTFTGEHYGSGYDSDKGEDIDGAFKSVKLTNVTKKTDPLTFKNQTDKDRKHSQKIDWNADEISKDEAANVTTLAADITDDRITSWNETYEEKHTAVGAFTLKNDSASQIDALTVDEFQTIDITGTTAAKLTLNSTKGTNAHTHKWSKTLSVTPAKGSYSYTDEKTQKAEASLKITKATITGNSSKFKTVALTDVVIGGPSSFTAYGTDVHNDAYGDGSRKYSQKYDWNAESTTYKDIISGDPIYNDSITSYSDSVDISVSAAGKFTLKGSNSSVAGMTVNYFQSADITGTSTISDVKLSGANGGNDWAEKTSQTLSVTTAKGTYSSSSEKSSKAEASLKVTKATLSGTFGSKPIDADFDYGFKTVDLTDIAVTTAASFLGATTMTQKSNKKYDWNAEEATFKEVDETSGGAIKNESITSYSETHDTKTSAEGKFTLKGSNSSVAGMTINGFQSVDVTGTSTVSDVKLSGAVGANSTTANTSDTLSVTTAKGTYSGSSESSTKAEASLKVTKATLNGDFSDFKSVTLTDVAVAGTPSFYGVGDFSRKSSTKYDWNAEGATFKEVDETSGGAIYNENITSYTDSDEKKYTAAGKFTLKGSNNSVTGLTVGNFKDIDVAGTVATVTLAGALGANSWTEKDTHTLSVTATKGTYSSSGDTSTKAEATLKVTKATLNGDFGNNIPMEHGFKSVELTDVAVGSTATFTGAGDRSGKDSTKYEWKAEDATFADVESVGITHESITSWNESYEGKDTAAGSFKFKGSNVVNAMNINDFKSIDVTGTVDKVKLTGASGANSSSFKNSKTLSVTAAKGTYSESSESSSKLEASLKVTKANLDGDFDYFKTVALTDVAVTSYPEKPEDPDTAVAHFSSIFDSSSKDSKKYEWKAEEATYAEVKSAGIFSNSITSWDESHETKDTAAGSFTFKGTNNVVNDLSVSGFQTVDVTGTVDNVNLTGVAGAISGGTKSSETLSVSATKGTYSTSFEVSDKYDTTLKVTKATMSGSFSILKSATLDDIATDGGAYFDGFGDSSSKSSEKYEWKAEEATFEDVYTTSGGAIYNESITSYNASSESSAVVSSTFTLKKTSNDAELSLGGFKSVDITGTIAKTTVGGVYGSKTTKDKESESLTISKKGTYSSSNDESAKSEATLKVTKATIDSAMITDQKAIALTDVKIDDVTFVNTRDEEESYSLKYEWNAEDASFASLVGGAFDENITSWNETSKSKSTVVGALTLKNSANDATIDDLSIDNFKSVDITLGTTNAATANVAVGSLSAVGDETESFSLKRTVSETKRTQDVKEEAEATASSTLKVTGKSTTSDITTLTLADGAEVGYSNITLTDAKIAKADPGHTISASSYAESVSYTASESATLETGSVVAVTLKVSKTYEEVGNGSFTASAKNYNGTYVAFDGTLNGYSTISLKDNVSIGNVDNTKSYGAGDYYVPWNGEYFDVIAAYEKGETSQGEKLTGNISGSYSLDNKGQITSNWKAVSGTASTGSFSQTAKVKAVTAGDITGYDKVQLDGVLSAGDIYGYNDESATVLTYKYAKDEEVANSKVETTSSTVSSTVTVKGKEFDSKMQLTAVGDISGYKTVTLTNATVLGDISTGEFESVYTDDRLKGITSLETVNTSVGSLTATDSVLTGSVNGFKTVTLTNSAAYAAFAGGDSSMESDSEHGLTFSQFKASDSFSAVSNKAQEKADDPDLNVLLAVGDVSGYKKVTLTDYSADDVATFASTASSWEFIPADPEKDGSVDTWKSAGTTKGTSLTAKTAKQHVVADAIVSNDMTVGNVIGFDTVDATGLASIGAVANAFFADTIDGSGFEGGRIYSNKHYGDWTATATESATSYKTVDVKAGSTVKISGLTDKNSMSEKISKNTVLTGSILGYQNVTLKDVTFAAGTAIDDTADYVFAGGKYSYSTAKKSDSMVSTSVSAADGSLKITPATAGEFTTYSAFGFKSANISFDNVATFADFTAGEETAQFTDGAFDYNKFKVSGSLELAGAEGSELTGRVVGFASATFTDVDMAASAEIDGFEIAYDTKTSTYSYAAKSEVTFKDSNATEDSIQGTITNAKEIKFTATADAGNDFEIDATIVSTAGNTTIEFDKCQATIADLSAFHLDAGDVIKLTSSVLEAPETTATIDLGDIADEAALNGMIANMSDVYISGSGDITFTTIGEQVFADTLAAAGITWDETVNFNGKHYDPTALA